MIYTSYFGNWRKVPAGMRIVGVTRYAPRGVENRSELAPSESLLRDWKDGVEDEDGFRERYLRELELRGLDKERLKRELDGCVLCCYEKKGEFCHRKFLSEWLGGVEEL